MHSLLQRQIKRHLGNLKKIPNGFKSFLKAVDRSYRKTDQTQNMLNTGMRSSVSLLIATLESTADGICVINLDRKVVDYNMNFVEMWRIPPPLIASRDSNRIKEFIWGQLKDETRARFLDKIEDLYRNPQTPTEDLIELADGRIFDRFTKPQYLGGKVVGIVCSFRDVSEQRRLHRILVENEKMSAVGQLAGGVAHEINNPLGIILGFAQSMRSDLVDAPPGVQMALDFIEKEANRCKNLVQNLMVFSRAPQGGALESLNLDLAIQEALPLIMAQSRVRDVELAKKLSGNLPPMLGNKSQLQQVVLNLCNNAIDSMPQGGTMTVETRVSVSNGQNWISLVVTDKGKGIDQEIQSKIFEPFFTTKEVGKGTGLGLSLVYEIVKKHNGTIEFESAPEKGTTFTVLFPTMTQAVPEEKSK